METRDSTDLMIEKLVGTAYRYGVSVERRGKDNRLSLDYEEKLKDVRDELYRRLAELKRDGD